MPLDYEHIRKRITEELNLKKFTDEEQREIMEKLEDNILSRIYMDVLDRLSPVEQEAFYVLGEKKDSVEFKEFLESKVSTLDAIIDNATTTFVDELKPVLK
jgi:SPX domain protein involved in polyphosphate accumulation